MKIFKETVCKTCFKSVLCACVFIAMNILSSCDKDEATEPDIDKGNDPNFVIQKSKDKEMEFFSRKVVVFGIDIYASEGVENDKLLHAANVLAQYLDNDEDGNIDNVVVVDKMKKSKAFLVMWKKASDIEDIEPPFGRIGQDLGSDETTPDFVKNGRKGTFDGALEEIWHLVSDAGYAQAYPEEFGTRKGTQIAKAMDKARGGFFEEVPESYPDNAWFTYDDETCDYSSQISEYFYWGLSSVLGAQENRLSEIGNEWKLNTKQKVEQTDTDLMTLLNNATYKLPIKLPDGSYKH
ncbi:MAG: hypothetical protein N4A71_16935 [Carboxylicivirga sp.]|jgi:hypothetical protein|nr:hypothetical protein [Carboxylicivirga sp.]